MKKTERSFSAGTIFTLCLTMIVIVGCIFMFSRMRADQDGVRLDAQRMIGMIGNAISGATMPPQSHVRTITVTPSPVDNGITETKTDIPVPTEAPALQKETAPLFSFQATFAGVLGFHSDISASVYDQNTKSFHYQDVLAPLSDYLTADFNTGVFPHIINTQDQQYTDVLASSSLLDAIRAAGFDELTLNSEYALDYGEKGVQDTVNAILERGFSCGGVNMGNAAQGRLMPLNSARIALFTYTEALTDAGKSARIGSNGQPLVTLFDLEEARLDIENAKAYGANCIMVFIHWGREDDQSVTLQQREIARQLALMGADVIIGSHPSRVLPVEIIETQQPDGRIRKTLVAYSMGTLVTESRDGNDISGMLLHLQISGNDQGQIQFDSIEYTPTYIWRQNVNGKMQYRVICSAAAPPAEMNQNQKEVMGRALNRIQDILEEGPAKQKMW